jgi:hypothetical protein
MVVDYKGWSGECREMRSFGIAYSWIPGRGEVRGLGVSKLEAPIQRSGIDSVGLAQCRRPRSWFCLALNDSPVVDRRPHSPMVSLDRWRWWDSGG